MLIFPSWFQDMFAKRLFIGIAKVAGRLHCVENSRLLNLVLLTYLVDSADDCSAQLPISILHSHVFL